MEHEAEVLADSIDTTSHRLSISRATIYREIKAGRLNALKALGKTLITRKAQQDWLNNLPALDTRAGQIN